jgi:hypothetical protein
MKVLESTFILHVFSIQTILINEEASALSSLRPLNLSSHSSKYIKLLTKPVNQWELLIVDSTRSLYPFFQLDRESYVNNLFFSLILILLFKNYTNIIHIKNMYTFRKIFVTVEF